MKAVIFDQDGIIIDSESANVNSAVKAFKKLGITIKEEEKDWIIGRRTEDSKDFFLEKYRFSYKEFACIKKEIYLELLKSAPLFDKTISLIKELHKMGVPIALTTSSGMESVLQVLKKAKLENVFDVLVTYEDYEKRKPHPDPYIITAKKLNLEPKDCVVIEDSFVGVEAAKKAGMKCIAIPTGYTKNQDFSKADLVVVSADKINIKLLNEF